MNENFTLVPTLTVHPDRLNIYNEIFWHKPKAKYRQYELPEDYEKKKYSHLLESDRKSHGYISPIAKRKITKAIDYLLLLSSDKKVHSLRTGRKFTFKIAFITLTLPSKQIHTDKEIKRKCLNHFLIAIQRKFKVSNYIWRSEKQQNGNLHFHILIDKFIHWNDVRNLWNNIINKLGYVDRYQTRMKEFYKDGFKEMKNVSKSWNVAKQKESYKRNLATDFQNPNSTDIHSIKKIHNLTNYFVKYMTKNEPTCNNTNQNEDEFTTSTGATWAASKNLQKIKGAKTEIDSQIDEEIKKLVDNHKCKMYTSDYFSVIYVDFESLAKYGADRIFEIFSKYIIEKFDYHIQTKITIPY